jgi:hypothetical protein
MVARYIKKNLCVKFILIGSYYLAKFEEEEKKTYYLLTEQSGRGKSG